MQIPNIQKCRNRVATGVKGFTLIELMVSISIFAIIMVVSVGTLLTLIDVNAKGQALASATTNLSFALDSMTREMRMGYRYYCKVMSGGERANPTLDFPAQGSTRDWNECDWVVFTRERDGFRVGYRLYRQDDQNKIQQKIVDTDGDTFVEWMNITSDDVFIDTFEVEVDDSDYYADGSDDQEQAFAYIFVKGHVSGTDGSDTEFSMQTRIVERRLDIY